MRRNFLARVMSKTDLRFCNFVILFFTACPEGFRYFGEVDVPVHDRDYWVQGERQRWFRSIRNRFKPMSWHGLRWIFIRLGYNVAIFIVNYSFYELWNKRFFCSYSKLIFGNRTPTYSCYQVKYGNFSWLEATHE